jgi:hypothetical protein
MPEIVINVPEKELAAILGKSLIPPSRSRLRWMCLGFAIQAGFVVALAMIPLLFPNAIHFLPRYWVTSIESPVTRPWKPQPKQPRTRAPITPRVVAKEVAEVQVAPPKPTIISPVLSSPVRKAVSARKGKQARLISIREKMFFEITPFMPHLTRYKSPSEAAKPETPSSTSTEVTLGLQHQEEEK